MEEWYEINNADGIDTPALAIYPDYVQENIDLAISIAGRADILRPHVKTNKMAEVCEMMIRSGITKFKCATIAEAEMLGLVKAPDVLLAYQPVGPKAIRLLELVKKYRDTDFSCLTDNAITAGQLNQVFAVSGLTLDVYIDLNVGMNRTGIQADKALALAKTILSMPNLNLKGIHAYDGHIHDRDIELRWKAGEVSFGIAENVVTRIKEFYSSPLHIVMGGTPTFPVHTGRQETECSPGTFVFWDRGYRRMFPDLPFIYAATVLSRVISVVDETRICLDLGYKSVAAENPLPRIHFLNAPEAVPVSQSEEHLVVEVKNSREYPVGTLLYGIPVHICPTVALYERAYVITENEYTDRWRVIARDRFINL